MTLDAQSLSLLIGSLGGATAAIITAIRSSQHQMQGKLDSMTTTAAVVSDRRDGQLKVIHDLTNSAMSAALKRIDELEGLVRTLVSALADGTIKERAISTLDRPMR